MSRLVGFLISGAHQRSLRFALWLAAFLVLLAGASWVVAEQLAQNMRSEIAQSLTGYERLRTNVLSTFEIMNQRLLAAPCSPAFLDEMRRIAFLPDGINELLYMPEGVVRCSVNSGLLTAPVDLGEADVDDANPFGMSFWFDRDLTFLDLGGMIGTIARHGQLGMVLPSQELLLAGPRWMEQEAVLVTVTEKWWHRAGTPGVYLDARGHHGAALPSLMGGALYAMTCDPAGLHCIAGRTYLSNLFALGWASVGVILLLSAVLAAWLAQQVHGFIQRHWSFEERFLRRFDKGAVICAYQPLLDLRCGLVTGCEVLARWRDVDGTIVPPDRFLSIIESHGLTERFTAMVIAHAHADLAPRLPAGLRLQVNFNIFPQDLDAARLVPLFAPFLAADSPFIVAVELVETAEVRPELAQVEIERLRAAGLSVYIDDFGAGYSSMHNLAELSIDGVKLDRSFAMAPEHSVMARMLDHAIELVQTSGRSLVVEGVETREKLAALTAGGRVDFAQGYAISRPLLIDPFMAFLREHGPLPAGRSQLVA
ncbi:MAG: hypothetical protein ABS75_01005 [Pelagibacterium sp. SCN 63-23]|nr:MAG: hypothetical protein ABS75_01005 [Pelagibacterium sp. SCN 63-23]